MGKTIISVTNTDIPIDSLLTTLHIDNDDDFIESITAMHRTAMEIAKPVAVYAALSPDLRNDRIWLNGVEFEEPFVYKMLSGCDVVVPYVASCGREIDAWSKSYTDIFEQFVADTLKQMCLGVIREKLFSEVTEKHFDIKRNVSIINPGSLKEWQITGQTQLFEVLGEVTIDIGVELSDSFLMIPNKSISGVIFQSEEAFENCQLCPRLNCPGRRVPYSG